MQREISACRIARDDDVRRGHAFVKQILYGGNGLAQLFREGVFWCESCTDGQQEMLALRITRRPTVVEHGNPDGTLVFLMKGLKHANAFNRGWNDITSA